MTYEEILERLFAHADEGYRAFHGKLLKNPSIKLIGVRMPVLRALAKEWKKELGNILTFPDEYYEVTFLKCACAGMLPFREFTAVIDGLVPLLDNWATCDCFTAPCIAKNREAFLPYIQKYLADEREFVRRYALVTLLHYYVEKEYLPLVYASVRTCTVLRNDGGGMACRRGRRKILRRRKELVERKIFQPRDSQPCDPKGAGKLSLEQGTKRGVKKAQTLNFPKRVDNFFRLVYNKKKFDCSVCGAPRRNYV